MVVTVANGCVIVNRGAEMDAGQSEGQSTGVLERGGAFLLSSFFPFFIFLQCCMYIALHYICRLSPPFFSSIALFFHFSGSPRLDSTQWHGTAWHGTRTAWDGMGWDMHAAPPPQKERKERNNSVPRYDILGRHSTRWWWWWLFRGCALGGNDYCAVGR